MKTLREQVMAGIECWLQNHCKLAAILKDLAP
jgi:hypothetical protein